MLALGMSIDLFDGTLHKPLNIRQPIEVHFHRPSFLAEAHSRGRAMCSGFWVPRCASFGPFLEQRSQEGCRASLSANIVHGTRCLFSL